MNVTIIADASYCPQTRAAGYGYWVASERGKAPGGGSMRGPVDGSGAAEMMAVCNAIYDALKLGLVEPGDHLLVQTDCQSAILAFDGQRQVMTRDELAAKRSFADLCTRNRLRVRLRHVKGHTNRREARYVTNNRCDQRAREGMQAARERFSV